MAKRRTRLWLLPVMLAAAGFCYLDNCTVQTTFRTLRCATLPEAFSGLRIGADLRSAWPRLWQ